MAIARLAEAFESTPMNEGMLRLARSLKAMYSIGIITDNKKDRIDCLKRYLGLDSLFDPITVSAECGSGKEGPEIFQRALSHLGLAPSETIFIDNSKRNLVASAALGMNTVFFDDSANDLRGLMVTLKSKHGVTVPCDT